MRRVEGKVDLVTGASRGLGLAIAQALGREGSDWILVARDRKALEPAVKSVPGDALVLVADVTRPTEVGRLFRRVQQKCGRLDILINHAGVFTCKLLTKTTNKEWRNIIETNLTSLFLTTRAALPVLRRSRAPHVVNILIPSISSLSPTRSSEHCSHHLELPTPNFWSCHREGPCKLVLTLRRLSFSFRSL